MIEIYDFYAEWCGPCKSLAPVVEEVANENSDITLRKIDIEDDTDDLCSKYRIRAVPTLVYIKDGVLVSKTIGLVSKDTILENVEKCKNN